MGMTIKNGVDGMEIDFDSYEDKVEYLTAILGKKFLLIDGDDEHRYIVPGAVAKWIAEHPENFLDDSKPHVFTMASVS